MLHQFPNAGELELFLENITHKKSEGELFSDTSIDGNIRHIPFYLQFFKRV